MLNFKHTQPLRSLHKIIESILAASGILIDKMTMLRFFIILLILLNVLLTYFFRDCITLNFAIVFFSIMFVLRYWILFTSFGNNGLAQKLTTRYGEKKAYTYYEAATGFMFFYRSTSFNFLVMETANPLPTLCISHSTMIFTAWTMIIVATVVNVWATMIIGIDVYYYKDMFVRRPIGNFEVKGPFRYFSNPMYGIGQFNAYGLALLSGSIWGILATVLNQIMMYIFYFLFEKPHIERLFGKNLMIERV